MYNTKEEFLVDFQKWREQNGLPKRDQCREMFRVYRECELGTVSSNIFDYILQQEKPAMFLDSLFKKGNYTNRYIKKTVYSNSGYRNLPETSPGFDTSL